MGSPFPGRMEHHDERENEKFLLFYFIVRKPQEKTLLRLHQIHWETGGHIAQIKADF